LNQHNTEGASRNFISGNFKNKKGSEQYWLTIPSFSPDQSGQQQLKMMVCTTVFSAVID
jgi:hypothetical protein